MNRIVPMLALAALAAFPGQPAQADGPVEDLQAAVVEFARDYVAPVVDEVRDTVNDPPPAGEVIDAVVGEENWDGIAERLRCLRYGTC